MSENYERAVALYLTEMLIDEDDEGILRAVSPDELDIRKALDDLGLKLVPKARPEGADD